MTVAKRQSKAMSELGKNQVNTKTSGLQQQKRCNEIKNIFEMLTIIFCYFDCLSSFSHLPGRETALGFPGLFLATGQVTMQ